MRSGGASLLLGDSLRLLELYFVAGFVTRTLCLRSTKLPNKLGFVGVVGVCTVGGVTVVGVVGGALN
jgi:hypothetical protein